MCEFVCVCVCVFMCLCVWVGDWIRAPIWKMFQTYENAERRQFDSEKVLVIYLLIIEFLSKWILSNLKQILWIMGVFSNCSKHQM